MANIAIISINKLMKAGVTSVILNLLNEIDRTNLCIYVFTNKEVDETVLEQLEKMGIEIVHLNKRRSIPPVSYIQELSNELKKREIDVLHVHGNSATMWFEILAAKMAGVKIRIAHSHNSSCSSKVVHYALRPLLIHDMTLGIGCSDLAQRFAFNDKKSVLLKNGITTEKFQFDENERNCCRREFDLENKFIVGHVGNFLPVKNHIFICKIVNELKTREIKNFKFICLGDGATRNEIENYIEANHLEENMILLGSRTDMSRFYQAMDLFVLPSHFEGFPMVLVEAQTAGLDCIISDKVSRTTDIIGTAQFLNIDGEEAVKVWADSIFEKIVNNTVKDRTIARYEVEEAGYSAKHSAKYLENLYRGNASEIKR